MIRIVALLALFATPAAAQGPCMPRADLVAQLADRYGESVTASGITGGALLEVWAAPSGSWTITISNTAGLACVVAAGDSFEALPVAPRGDAL